MLLLTSPIYGASLAFPAGYSASSADRNLFIALTTGNNGGDVYRVSGSRPVATDLNTGAAYGATGNDIASLFILFPEAGLLPG